MANETWLPRATAEQVTRELTERLAELAAKAPASLAGGVPKMTVGPVFESGNCMEGETGFVVEITAAGLLFNVEVFGPTYNPREGEDDGLSNDAE